MVPGMDPVYAFAYDGRIAEELRTAGCEVHILGPAWARDPFSIWRARRKLSALRRARECDAAVAHSAWSLALLGPAAGRPLLFWQHDAFDRPDWLARWSAWTPLDLVIANSRFTAGTTKRVHRTAPATVIHPPVAPELSALSVDRRAFLRARWGADASSVVILQAGRFERWKGHLLHLESLARLKHRGEWTLWIAGAPQRSEEFSYFDEIERAAVALGIQDRIRFLGHRTDLSAIMRASDIYCQPNTGAESFGLTFVEAMQAGLPVVTTDMGGPKEIIDSHHGVLVPAADALRLAQALERLLSDKTLRRDLGSRGAARATSLCDPRTQMTALAAVVESLREPALAA